MEILLARHGITAGNLLHRHMGVTDEPLCPQGIAALRAADPTVETVYVSPLQRTRQTAAILYPNAAQIVVPGLAEMDFGAFENKNYQELSDNTAYRAWVDSLCEDPCPGGESKAGFSRRVCAAFEALVSRSLAEGCKRLVIVAHGGTIMSVGERFALPKRDYFAWKVPNGAVCRFETDEALWAQRQLRTVDNGSLPD